MADNVLRTVPGSGELIAADEVTDSELGTCKVQYVKLMSGTLDDTDKIASTGGAMNVNVVAGENVIHEYQNGDPPSSAYGSLMMGTDGNAIVPLKTTNEGEIVGSFEITNPSIAIEDGASASGVEGILVAGKDSSSNAQFLATDSDGHLQVDVVSGGGSSTGAIVDGESSSIKATVLDYTNSNPLAVRLTDTNGNYVTAGGGTEYTEGDTDTTITGTAVMFEADTSTSTLMAVSNTYPLPVSDAGGSLTVDGSISASQSGTWNIGVDDGGGSLTVDGSVTVTQSTASNLNCTEASASSIKTAVELIDDAVYADGASWSDGSSKGILAHGLYQSTPQTVSSGTVAPLQVDSNGKLLIGGTSIAGSAGSPNSGVISVQGISGMTAVQMGLSVANCIQWSHYSNEYTTAQTSTDLVAASGSTKIYVGRLTISTGDTTAGLVTVYFGTDAYSAGTSKTVFRGNFAPSSSSYPSVVIGSGVAPFCISAASDALKITTSDAITVYVQVDYVQV